MAPGPRRVTRKRGQPTAAESDTELDTNYNLTDGSEPAPKRRKQITTTRAKRPTAEGKSANSQVKKKKTGGLAKLADIPFDILAEIFSLLHPLDVLHLSRANKFLRTTLMSRSSAFIWKASLATLAALELPPCPKDLTEPQYIRLMFEYSCTFCNGPTLDHGQWGLRVRSCRSCLKHRVISEWDAECLLPHDFRDTGLPLSQIAPRLELPNANKLLKCGTWYLKSDVLALAETLKDVLHDEAKFHAFLRDRLLSIAIINMHAHQMAIWQRDYGHEREVDAIRDRRKNAILDKLKKMGYEDTVEKMSDGDDMEFASHPLVKPAKDLTDRMWANMRDQMVEFMEKMKARCLARDWRANILPKRLPLLRKVLKEYYLSQGENDILPSMADFCFMKEFLDVIDAPKDVEVTEASFSDVVARLPELSDVWREQAFEKIRALLPTSVVEQNHSPHDVLALATTLFSCEDGQCANVMTYDRLLVHECLTERPYWWRGEGPELPGINPETCCEELKGIPWGSYKFEAVSFSEVGSQHARRIVELCGRDPDTTTAEEMDKLDARLNCLSCSSLKRAGLTWRQAVSSSICPIWIKLTSPPRWRMPYETHDVTLTP
ncbi:hypothetical protein GLOTRDRAFT_133339 [Gloeophyllum trabeum ATCC 11539]|uniref:F-box domain-containing protein n=1 Tax=Gloeophyllum trabeum (strain ATCC 11539 / FP-39264 / Madison 617) TaxID=670483 RepID=S7PUH5_GLOTA|nr:uncharacterized protein GLOTRDRAFT_133339 [Gloeophyllum trabeum ATCC 11539]EPQ51013.1 hypothetical protein GLOTRDRAFT_133339 [Gloeophyllum trabeum ATCC 11539]